MVRACKVGGEGAEMYGSHGRALSLDPRIALHSEACCSWAASCQHWGLGEEGLLGILLSPLWSIFHILCTRGHQPRSLPWTQDGLRCLVLPGEGEAGGEGDLTLGHLGCDPRSWGQGRAALPAQSSSRTAVPAAHTLLTLPLCGVTSCSAQPDIISLLNLFSLRPHVNHFSHCFPPNSLWPGLLFLLLMCQERGARGPSRTWRRDPTLLHPAPEMGFEPADGGAGRSLSHGQVRKLQAREKAIKLESKGACWDSPSLQPCSAGGG